MARVGSEAGRYGGFQRDGHSGIADIIQPLSITNAGVTDANGTVTFTFPSIPVSQDWIFSCNIADAPSTAVFIAESTPTNLGSWTAGNNAGPFKCGANETLVVKGFALLANLTYQCTITGEAVTSGKSSNVFPYPSTSTVVTQNQAGLKTLTLTLSGAGTIGGAIYTHNATNSTIYGDNGVSGAQFQAISQSQIPQSFGLSPSTGIGCGMGNTAGGGVSFQAFNTVTGTSSTAFSQTGSSITTPGGGCISANGLWAACNISNPAGSPAASIVIGNIASSTTYFGATSFNSIYQMVPDPNLNQFYSFGTVTGSGLQLCQSSFSSPGYSIIYSSPNGGCYGLAFNTAQTYGYVVTYGTNCNIIRATYSSSTGLSSFTQIGSTTASASNQPLSGNYSNVACNNSFVYWLLTGTNGIGYYNIAANTFGSFASGTAYVDCKVDSSGNFLYVSTSAGTVLVFNANTQASVRTVLLTNSTGEIKLLGSSASALTTPPTGYAYRILTVTAYGSTAGTVVLSTNSAFTSQNFCVMANNTTVLLNGRLLNQPVYAQSSAAGTTYIEIAYDLVFYDLTSV